MQGRQAAVVRQISNPMAGTDTTLLSLTGVGASRKAAFGFMSCDRHVGAAEGVNVLQENKIWRGARVGSILMLVALEEQVSLSHTHMHIPCVSSIPHKHCYQLSDITPLSYLAFRKYCYLLVAQ